MMQNNVSANFSDLGSFTMVSLPYTDYQYSMIVLLPKKKDGLADLEKNLTAADLAKWIKKMSHHAVDLKPKFKVTAEFQLNDTLSKWVRRRVQFGRADFSGMTTRQKLFISAVVHKAFVDVNEKGTGRGCDAVSPSPGVGRRRRFLDRLFLFLIHNRD